MDIAKVLNSEFLNSISFFNFENAITAAFYADKNLNLIIAGIITISVTLSMAGAYLLDFNKYSFEDFKGPPRNAETYRHSMFLDSQRMRN